MDLPSQRWKSKSVPDIKYLEKRVQELEKGVYLIKASP